jgi:prepilin-type N-terminal cleavage/methylation domain-containing protein
MRLAASISRNIAPKRRRPPHSKTLTRALETYIMREAFWSAAVLCRFPCASMGENAKHDDTGANSAFTLIELVISAAIGAMILTAAALCLNASISSQKMIDPRVDTMQCARVALALMSADLRAACPLDKDYAFLGDHRAIGRIEADNIDFATHNYSPRHPREGDWCETSYYVDKNAASGQFGLWRRRNPTLAADPLSGGSREEIAPGIGGVRMEYYDGLDWYDTWGDQTGRKSANREVQKPNLVGMPQAVRITLSFNSDAAPKPEDQETPATNGPPMVFQTVVYLELAANSTQSDSSSGAASGATNSVPGAPGQSLN